jgi:hypothetical protein
MSRLSAHRDDDRCSIGVAPSCGAKSNLTLSQNPQKDGAPGILLLHRKFA